MQNKPSPDSLFFATLRLADRRSDLLVREIGVLRSAMRAAMVQMPFTIDTITVLPSVMHVILALPENDTDAAGRMSLLKRRFAQCLGPLGAGVGNAQGAGIWIREHWICQLNTALDRSRHRTIIHNAAVDAGLCAQPQDWPHCSVHRALRAQQTDASGTQKGEIVRQKWAEPAGRAIAS